MWDALILAEKLQALDANAQAVIAHGTQRHDDRLVLLGVDVAGRNIERLYKLCAGADFEARMRTIEAALATRAEYPALTAADQAPDADRTA